MSGSAWDLEEVYRIEKLLVASIGVEGGGAEIYGTQSDGIWSFWGEGSSIDLDENDDEVWRSWSSEPVGGLDLVVPKDWPLSHPVEIHSDFLAWFRGNYDEAVLKLPQDQRRYQEKHRHGRWTNVPGMAN
jgi:hypothetical protein